MTAPSSTSYGGSNYTSGNAGNPSSIGGVSGFTTVTGAAGTAGSGTGSAGSGGYNTASTITGTSVTYGKNGAVASSSGTAKGGDTPGSGGNGAYKSSGTTYSGAGADGIVVVKITALKQTVSKSSSMDLLTTDSATDLTVPSAFPKSCKWTATSGKTSVATVEVNDSSTSTKTPSIKVTPVASGTATITVQNSDNTTSCVFTWTVTVTVAEPKDVLLDDTVTIDTGVSLGGRYYYKLVSDNSTYVAVNSPTSATRPSTGSSSTGDLKVTGKKETTSPVIVRLQTTGTTSSGTYSDLKLYSVTVFNATEGKATVDVMQYHTTTFTTGTDWTTATVTDGSALIETPTREGKTVTIVAKGTTGTAKVRLYNGETLVKLLTVNIVEQTPEEGTDTMSIGTGRTKTYTTESDLTRAEVTAGSSYIQTPTVSGKTVSITARTTADVSATVNLYNGNIWIKTLTVNVTQAPTPITFKGRTIEYMNGTVDTTVENELILTFTDTTKTGVLSIPEDAQAQILVVGGGAGGVRGKKPTSSGKAAYAGNGGCGGKVVEKTLTDGYVLPKGDYTITVGAGGASLTADVNDLTGDNPGNASSLVGAGENLVAAGGEAYVTQEAQGTGDPAATASGSKNSQTSVAALDGTGAGASDSSKYSHDKTGWTSSVSGNPVKYGEGGDAGAGGVSINDSSDGKDGTDGLGNGGGGSVNAGTSGKGGNGIVIVRITYPEVPSVKTFSVTPILKGDALFTSAITLEMTNMAGAVISGTYDWAARETVPQVSGDYEVIFTPADTATYKITSLWANVVVLEPQEPTETHVADDQLPATAKTTVSADYWYYVIASGAEFINTDTITLVRDPDDGTATLTVYGLDGVTGSAYIDLYAAATANDEQNAAGTFVKRIIVAVLPDPSEGTVNISVEEGLSDSTVKTTTKETSWNCVVQVGADFADASVSPTTSGSASVATVTVVGKVAGTAIIDVFSGSTTPGQGTLVKRVMATVVGPVEGYENRAVGYQTSNSIKVTTETAISRVETIPASQSLVTITSNGTTTTITGRNGGKGELVAKLYAADGTLIKTVNVQVTDPPSTLTWETRTISYLGCATKPMTLSDGDLLLTFTATDGLLEIPEDAICDILVVGGAGAGASAASSYLGNGGGGGRATYVEHRAMAGGVYTVQVGQGGAQTAVGTKCVSGQNGNPSSITGGAGFEEVRALGGLGGADGVSSSSGTTIAGIGGAELDCKITGTTVRYGENGAGGSGNGAGTAGTDGRGKGGNGAGTSGAGGKGGDGVVIVRLHGFVETPTVLTAVTGTITYGQAATDAIFAGSMKNAANKEVAGTFAWSNAGAVQPLDVAASGTEFDVVFTPYDTTYYYPTTVKGTLVVNRAPVTVTPVATNKVYGAADPVLGYTVEPALIDGDAFEGALAREAGTDVGTYDITLGDLTNDNYAVTFDTAAGVDAFMIAKKPVTVTPDANQSKTYGADYTITYTYDPALVDGDTFTGVLAAENAVGDQPITQGSLAINDGNGGQNYALTFTSGVTLRVNPILVAVPAAKTGLVYDKTEQTGVDAGTGYVLTGTTKATDADDYTATATLETGYAWTDGKTTPVEIPWSIAKATYDMGGVTFEGKTVTYNGEVQTLAIAGTLPDGVSVDYADNANKDYGTYTVTAKFTGDAKNYNAIADKTATLTINRASVSVKADDKSKTYDTDDPELTATVTGLFGEDTVAYEVTRAEGDDVGTYAITASGDAVQGNYAVSFEGGTFTITSAKVAKPEAPAEPFVYNGEDQTAVASSTGYAVTDGTKKDAGTYQAVAKLAKNYVWTDDSTADVTIEWTIQPAPVTVTADGQEKVAGNADPEFTKQVTQGEVFEGDALVGTLTCVRPDPEVAGKYDITQADDWVNPNYAVTYVKGTLTVKEAVASYSGINYDSVSNAVTAASEMSGGEGAVTVLVDTDEKIVIPEGSTVTIDPNGKETGGVENNGEMDIKIPDEMVEVGSTQVVFTVEGTGTINAITTTDESKEVVYEKEGTTVTATVRTSADVLGQTKPDGSQSLTNKIDNLCAFLLENKVEAYTKAHTTPEEISAALNEKQEGTGENKLELWKDYALGITPTTPVQPVAKPEGDTDETKITLAIPEVAAAQDNQSGDYTITYEVVDSTETKQAESDDAGSIKVPLTTGTYKIKAVFTPKK